MSTPEQIGRRWIELFDRKDVAGLMQFYTDQSVNAQPHLPQPMRGRQAIQEHFDNIASTFPDLRMVTSSVVTNDDSVAMEWTFSGTHAPTGKRVSLAGVEFCKLNPQGLIIDQRGYFDVYSFMNQLGLIPQPQQ
jgi:steroid delta-isomerase-like uncharacterized protein